MNRLSPPSYCDIFDINYDINDRNTRHKSDIHAIVHRIRARTMCIKVYGATLYVYNIVFLCVDRLLLLHNKLKS